MPPGEARPPRAPPPPDPAREGRRGPRFGFVRRPGLAPSRPEFRLRFVAGARDWVRSAPRTPRRSARSRTRPNRSWTDWLRSAPEAPGIGFVRRDGPPRPSGSLGAPPSRNWLRFVGAGSGLARRFGFGRREARPSPRLGSVGAGRPPGIGFGRREPRPPHARGWPAPLRLSKSFLHHRHATAPRSPNPTVVRRDDHAVPPGDYDGRVGDPGGRRWPPIWRVFLIESTGDATEGPP